MVFAFEKGLWCFLIPSRASESPTCHRSHSHVGLGNVSVLPTAAKAKALMLLWRLTGEQEVVCSAPVPGVCLQQAGSVLSCLPRDMTPRFT